MFEKVNPNHPDKIADRIAGAIVDLAYEIEENPKIAVEVLVGHNTSHVIIETSTPLDRAKIGAAIHRIAGRTACIITVCPQDKHLAENQSEGFRCGDNGIFLGTPVTDEQRKLSKIAHEIYTKYPYDGKYIIDDDRLIICQSNANTEELKTLYPGAVINPLGDWVDGINVDTGAVNRKLGSDMADSVTGGGLHGKDLSKADVSVNIYDWGGLYEKMRRVSCWCCPLQSLKELRVLYKDYPQLWSTLKRWDKMTWRNFRADYSVEDLEKRFDLEKEWLELEKDIKSKEFYAALKERLRTDDER